MWNRLDAQRFEVYPIELSKFQQEVYSCECFALRA